MTWIKHPLTLTGKQVSLIPLEESHFETLVSLSKDERIWQHYAIDANNSERLRTNLTNGLEERETGTQYPFVISLKTCGRIIGSTRFLDLQPHHGKLEIGWTWLHPDYWGTTVNIECKLLLLTYCFEELQAKRVQLKTDEKNIRSRKAIEKIGGQFEGILRNDMIRYNGTNRNSAYYSIIDSEWPHTKINLLKSFRTKESSLPLT